MAFASGASGRLTGRAGAANAAGSRHGCTSHRVIAFKGQHASGLHARAGSGSASPMPCVAGMRRCIRGRRVGALAGTRHGPCPGHTARVVRRRSRSRRGSTTRPRRTTAQPRRGLRIAAAPARACGRSLSSTPQAPALRHPHAPDDRQLASASKVVSCDPRMVVESAPENVSPSLGVHGDPL